MNDFFKDLGWFILKDNILTNYVYWLFSKVGTIRKEKVLNEDLKRYKKHPAYANFDFTQNTNKLFVLRRLNEFRKASGLCLKGQTSGSTNTPMPVFRSLRSIFFDELSLRAHWYQQGVKFNPKIATLRGDNLFSGDYVGKKYWKTMPFTRRLIMSSFHLSPDTAVSYFNELDRYKPDVILAYPSVIRNLTKLAKDFNWKPNWDLKVFTSGESFSKVAQKEVKTIFTNLYDHYGQAERVARLQQCFEGNYHIVEWYSKVELVPYGDKFKLLGSNIRNNSMPLYRYDCGDLLTGKGNKPCGCGLSSPYFSEIIGRIGEEITLKNGVKIGSAAISLIFYGLEGIHEAQLLQLKDKKLLLKYSTSDGLPNKKTEEVLYSAFIQRFGELELTIEFHKKIERDKSGKLPPVKVES